MSADLVRWAEAYAKRYTPTHDPRPGYLARRRDKNNNDVLGQMSQARFLQLASEVAKGNDPDGTIHRRLGAEMEAQERAAAAMKPPPTNLEISTPTPAGWERPEQGWLEAELGRVMAA
jgi:hypothetical protein